MPAEIISIRIDPGLAVEVIQAMNDYGAAGDRQLPLDEVAYRQDRINALLSELDGKETALDAYATTTGTDVSALKAAGLTKKQDAKADAAAKGFAPRPE